MNTLYLKSGKYDFFYLEIIVILLDGNSEHV